MKNIVLSAAAVFAMSSFAIAGGDITPVEEPVVEVPEVVAPSVGGFYLGLAYGYLNASIDASVDLPNGGTYNENYLDDDFGEIMIQAGYKFNEYVAVEGRYWFGVNDGSFLSPDNDLSAGELGASIDSWGIYVKPMYPVAEGFNIYALLGYASSDLTIDGYDEEWTSDSWDGFSWGIGAEYAFNENVSIFVDYTSIYDDSDNRPVIVNGYPLDVELEGSVDVIDFGVTYKF